MTHISRALKCCGDSNLPLREQDMDSSTHANTTKGLSHNIFFSEMYQNSVLPWLPLQQLLTFNEGHLPQKARSAADTQSFIFSRLTNLIKSILFSAVRQVQLTSCPQTLFSTDWLTFAEENSRCHKISLFQSHWPPQHYNFNFNFHLNFSLCNLFMRNCLCAHTKNCCITHKLFPSLISGSEALCKAHNGKNNQSFIWLTDTISQE